MAKVVWIGNVTFLFRNSEDLGSSNKQVTVRVFTYDKCATKKAAIAVGREKAQSEAGYGWVLEYEDPYSDELEKKDANW